MAHCHLCFLGGLMTKKKFLSYNSSLLFYIGCFIALCVFLITVVRAAYTGITYDEAYTYLVYAKDFDILDPSLMKSMFTDSFANNHWLNTILIHFFQSIFGLYYDEFIIRLPNLIFFFFYLCCSLFMLKKKILSFFPFLLLTCNYYLDEFFGLARGYGISASIVLFGLLFYKKWKKEGCEHHSTLTLCFFLFILSAYAQTVTLLITASLGLTALVHLVKKKKFLPYLKSQWPFLIPISLFALLILIYHFFVSDNDKPLFSSDYSFFDSFVRSYVRMFIHNEGYNYQVGRLLSFVFLLSLILMIIKKHWSFQDFMVPLALYIFLLLLVEFLFHKGYFTERLLLPAYPFLVFGFVESLVYLYRFIQGYLPFSKYLEGAALACMATAVLLLFVKKVDITYTRDWYDDYSLRWQTYTTPDYYYFTNEIIDRKFAEQRPPVTFYQKKLLYMMEKGY